MFPLHYHLRSLFRQWPWKKVKGRGTLRVRLEGSIDIEPSSPPSPFGGNPDRELITSLPDLFNLFQYAAYDPRVQSILINIERLSVGYATLQEIKRMMHLFRQSGKALIGYCSAGAEKELFLGLACDELYIPPDGGLDLRGFSTAATFVRGVFDKIGIEPQVQRIGKYKSFGDTFNRTAISEAQREVLSSLLTESSEFWAHTIAKELNKSVDEVKAIWGDTGYKTVNHWRDSGFISGTRYLDQVEEMLALRNAENETAIPFHLSVLCALSEDMKTNYSHALQERLDQFKADLQDFDLTRDFEKYPRRNPHANISNEVNKTTDSILRAAALVSSSRRQLKALPALVYLRKMRKGSKILRGLMVKEFPFGPRIAIINAAGGINTGKSSKQGVGGKTLGSETLISLVRRAREDPNIKAVVIRVDSPGGSALASDLMWREIRQLSKVKPVVASMVNVAASGGYYISMACDYILAEELTITGSIGVVTSKFNAEVLNRRIGYNSETLSRGRYAEVLSTTRGFTEEEETYFEDGAMAAYRSFTTKAAASRSMSIEQMQEVAQGRVWTGRQALEIGLVDEIGGLWSALNVAARLAGLPLIGGRDGKPTSNDCLTFLTAAHSDVRVDVLREPSQGLQLPFPLLSSILSSLTPSSRSGPQAVVDEAFSDFVKQPNSSSLLAFLSALGINEGALLDVLQRYLL